jgi:CRISPR-associated protein Cas2
MKAYGEPLQYSVFVCDLDGMEKTAMLTAVSAVIKHTEDSVVVIDLGEAHQRGTLCFEFLGTRRPLPRSAPPIL